MIRRVWRCTPLVLLSRQFIVFAFLNRKWIVVHMGSSRRIGPHRWFSRHQETLRSMRRAWCFLISCFQPLCTACAYQLVQQVPSVPLPPLSCIISSATKCSRHIQSVSILCRTYQDRNRNFDGDPGTGWATLAEPLLHFHLSS